MIKIIQHITYFILILCVLIASIGLPLHKITCDIEGEKYSLLFSQKNDCCSHHQTHKHQKEKEDKKHCDYPDNCCEFSFFLLKINFQNYDLKQNDINKQLVQLKKGFLIHVFQSHYLRFEIENKYLYPPPKTGRNICVLKKSFLI